MADTKSNVLARLAKIRGEEIRKAREGLGWSQAQLAEAAETTQQTVDRIERGVTGNSKALPKVRKAVGLPDFFPATAPSNTLLQPDRDSATIDIAAYIERTDKLLKVAEGTDLPIYAMKDGGRLYTTSFSDTIPKPYPVQNVKDAYGIISRDYSMEPVIRPGDIVIVNPNLPPLPETEVVLSRMEGDDYTVMLRSLIKENESSWTVVTPLGGHPEIYAKDEWPRAELIVAKISRVR